MRNKSSHRRSLRLEQLEVRRVLTAWHNDGLAADVDGQNGVTPVDALIVINELNNRQYSDSITGALPVDRPADAPFVDVLDDSIVNPVDALRVINVLDNVQVDPNVFVISANASDDAVVGSVVPADGVNADSIFEFAKSEDIPQSIRDALALQPGEVIQGAADAPVLMIEYVDFACPICGLYHPLFKQALEDFDGEIAIVQRHLPLTEIHPNAELAAIAVEAAGRQGHFEEMADLLFTRRIETNWDTSLSPNQVFRQFASELNLNLAQFQSDLSDPELVELVRASRTTANSTLGFTGTPSIAVNDNAAQLPGLNSAAVNQFFQTAVSEVETPFKLDRVTGQIRVRDASLLTEPSYTFDVMVNGQAETITINVS
jgi:protein-disulfide isomerase